MSTAILSILIIITSSLEGLGSNHPHQSSSLALVMEERRHTSINNKTSKSKSKLISSLLVPMLVLVMLVAVQLMHRHSVLAALGLDIQTSSAQDNEARSDNNKRNILEILNAANITSINEENAKLLPTWEDIASMYGDKPIIHGLETCEHYRNMVKPEDRTIGPAGLFNTGTNLVWKLMADNCHIDGEILWQAPWGKHSLPSNRLKRVAWDGEGINQTAFFPLMMIKDPFSWMNSLCRHSYGAISWYSEYDKKSCPNLVRRNITDHDETAPVKLWTGKTHDSLLDVWNYYYGEEWEVERTKFPHLTIRYEDLLFHGREVSRIACECVGGNITTDFHYEKESAKGSKRLHKGSNDLIRALLQYGDPARRLNGFTKRDLRYARRNSAAVEMIKKYGYSDC